MLPQVTVFFNEHLILTVCTRWIQILEISEFNFCPFYTIDEEAFIQTDSISAHCMQNLISSLIAPFIWLHLHSGRHTEKTVLLDQRKFCYRNKIILLLFVQQNCFVGLTKCFCWGKEIFYHHNKFFVGSTKFVDSKHFIF